MEHVWDMNADPFSNTIEVHIRNIRKKLGLPSNRNLIRTISGRGYMLDSSEASTSK
jgi:two-component system response regulator VanR